MEFFKYRNKLSTGLLLLAVLLSPLWADTWYNDYERAKEAAQKGNWQEVILYARRAMKEKPEPKLKAKTVGLRFVDYLPYYYLGEAYFYLEKYEDARASFNTSLQYGAVRQQADYLGRLRRMMAACDRQLKPRMSENTAAIRKYIAEGDNYLSNRNLKAARESYVRARQLIDLHNEEKPRQEEVNRKLRDITREENHQRLMRRADTAYRARRYDEAETALKQVLEMNPNDPQAGRFLTTIRRERDAQEKKPVTAPERVQKTGPGSRENAGSVVERLIKEGEKLFNNGNIEDARKKFSGAMQVEPNSKAAKQWLQRLDCMVVDARLQQGMTAYFRADLEAAEQLLRESLPAIDKIPGNKRARLVAMRFLAVILVEKYYLGLEGPANSLEETKKIIKKIYELEPGFQLESEYFSPKVIERFNKLRTDGEK